MAKSASKTTAAPNVATAASPPTKQRPQLTSDAKANLKDVQDFAFRLREKLAARMDFHKITFGDMADDKEKQDDPVVRFVQRTEKLMVRADCVYAFAHIHSTPHLIDARGDQIARDANNMLSITRGIAARKK